MPREDVWRHFTTVLENLLVVCNVVLVGSWEQLQAFLIEFAARRPGMSAPPQHLPHHDLLP